MAVRIIFYSTGLKLLQEILPAQVSAYKLFTALHAVLGNDLPRIAQGKGCANFIVLPNVIARPTLSSQKS